MKNSSETPDSSTPLNDLRALMAEAETMLGDLGHEPEADSVGALRQRLEAARTRLAGCYAGAKSRVIAGARCTDEAIRGHPYQALAVAAGVGAGIGLIVGVLLGRRRS